MIPMNQCAEIKHSQLGGENRNSHCVLRGVSLPETMGFLRETRQGFTEVTCELGHVGKTGL